MERNQEWADALRAEHRKIWEGYQPNTALVTPNSDQGDEPQPTYYEPEQGAAYLDDLEARRAAIRAVVRDELARRLPETLGPTVATSDSEADRAG